jgi:hypothetical protein
MSVWFDKPATTFAEIALGNTANSNSAIAANDSDYYALSTRSAA